MEEVKHERCKSCKCWRLPTEFLNAKGRKLKTCEKCREDAKKRRQCKHGKRKEYCRECDGSAFCKHNKQKNFCRECGGSAFCKHNKHKNYCRECDGSAFCKHNKQKNRCRDCKGSSICKHNKQKNRCRDCKGSSICKHNKLKYYCRECKGSSICKHNKQKRQCRECDPIGHLSSIVRTRIYKALKHDKELSSSEYIGCTIDEFKKHIESTFKEGMSWENYGTWHVDHIEPIKYNSPTIEEVVKRLHWKNTQALWAVDNIAKGNRYIG